MSADGWEDAFNVILGFALATIGQAVPAWWKARTRAVEMKAAIRLELRETALRLLGIVFYIGRRHGMFNRELLMWMKPELERYAGVNPTKDMLGAVIGLLVHSDEALAAMGARLKANTPPQSVPSEEPSYTKASVASLHDFGEDYASRILDVLTHLRMFNEAREQNMFYKGVTFTPQLSQADLASAMTGIDTTERAMVDRAQIVVDKISLIESLYPGK